MKKTLIMLWMAVCLMVSLVGCSSEEMDYNNPDVTLFVKQLKAGTYKMENEKGVIEVPHFTEEDIPELLKYAEDLTIIPSFPSVYNMNTLDSVVYRITASQSLRYHAAVDNALLYHIIYFVLCCFINDSAALISYTVGIRKKNKLFRLQR